MQEFSQAFEKLQRRWSLPHDLVADYYEALQHIPTHRFAEICDRVFHDCDFLPPPRAFTEISTQIGFREAEKMTRLESSEDRHDRVGLEEVESLSQEQRIENIRRLREMLRGASASMPAPDYPQSADLRVDKLNRWLQDPLLRNEAIAQINVAKDLEIKFDDNGAILGVRRAQN